MDISYIDLLNRNTAGYQFQGILRGLADDEDNLLGRCLHNNITGMLYSEEPHGDGLGDHGLHQCLLHRIRSGGIVGHDYRVHPQGLDPELSLSMDQTLVNTECHDIWCVHVEIPPFAEFYGKGRQVWQDGLCCADFCCVSTQKVSLKNVSLPY